MTPRLDVRLLAGIVAIGLSTIVGCDDGSLLSGLPAPQPKCATSANTVTVEVASDDWTESVFYSPGMYGGPESTVFQAIAQTNVTIPNVGAGTNVSIHVHFPQPLAVAHRVPGVISVRVGLAGNGGLVATAQNIGFSRISSLDRITSYGVNLYSSNGSTLDNFGCAANAVPANTGETISCFIFEFTVPNTLNAGGAIGTADLLIGEVDWLTSEIGDFRTEPAPFGPFGI